MSQASDTNPTANATFAQKAASVLKKAVGLGFKDETPAPMSVPISSDSDTPTEKLNPVASANALALRCRQYLSKSDVSMIQAAFRYADEAHLGQMRNSGLPYITHPIAVAEILASWHLDAQAIAAGLMHDVIEDTGISKIEMSEKFGVPIANLVDGVSKLDKLKFSSNEEAQAESFHKMLLAMSKDVRVILIKLADRLHNMRTLGAVKPHKKFRIAKETMEIYVPIASRLGLYSVYRELSDTSFSYMYPIRYRVIKHEVEKSRAKRKGTLERIHHEISDILQLNKIRAEVQDKDKGLWRIYMKMRERKIGFKEVLDVHSFRVIVPTRDECYRALGIIHGHYKPVPGRFKDFIAIPKANGYQSLHTTVIGPNGLPIEFQIRTQEMHHICEDGITAHWLYRDRGNSEELQESTQSWMQSLIEIQKNSKSSLEFMENIKVDIAPDRVYVFSPKGLIIQLPKGATAVDFAYQIHTELGFSAKGVEINGVEDSLTRPLKNGEMVKIIRYEKEEAIGPNPQWLTSVKTGRARTEIRQFLRNLPREKSIELGMSLLSNVAKQQRLPLEKCTDDDFERVYKSNGFESKDDLLSAVGYGQKDASLVVHQIVSQLKMKEPKPSTDPIKELNGRKFVFAPCCTPVFEDLILGHYIEQSNTLHIHRRDCSHCRRGFIVDPENWKEYTWNPDYDNLFNVKLDIETTDTRVTLEKITNEIARLQSSINGFSMTEINPQVAKLVITVKVANKRQLDKIMTAIRAIETVRNICRHTESDHRMKPIDVEIDE